MAAATPEMVALVVDDVAFMRHVLGRLLNQLGFAVVEADNGGQVLQLIREKSPDVVFLDIMMPGNSGIEVCKAIRACAATRNLPVIMCSAHSERKAVEAAIHAGATDFIIKPPERKMLQAKLTKHLSALSRLAETTREQDDLNI